MLTAQVSKCYDIGDALLGDSMIGGHDFSARLPDTTKLQERIRLRTNPRENTVRTSAGQPTKKSA